MKFKPTITSLVICKKNFYLIDNSYSQSGMEKYKKNSLISADLLWKHPIFKISSNYYTKPNVGPLKVASLGIIELMGSIYQFAVHSLGRYACYAVNTLTLIPQSVFLIFQNRTLNKNQNIRYPVFLPSKLHVLINSLLSLPLNLIKISEQ